MDGSHGHQESPRRTRITRLLQLGLGRDTRLLERLVVHAFGRRHGRLLPEQLLELRANRVIWHGQPRRIGLSYGVDIDTP